MKTALAVGCRCRRFYSVAPRTGAAVPAGKTRRRWRTQAARELHGRRKSNRPARLRSQQALARLSSKGKLVVVDDSDHEIQLFRPDVVIQAIADVSK